MTQLDRRVLGAVGLGLDKPAYGWPAGVGLRWSLPVATTIHNPGVDLTGQPRGWPTLAGQTPPASGWQIYRDLASHAVQAKCVNVSKMLPPGGRWITPLQLSAAGLTVDWMPPAGLLPLGDSLGAAGKFVLYADPTRLAVRLQIAPGTSRPGSKVPAGAVTATAYDAEDSELAQATRQLAGATTILLNGPGIARVEVELVNARVLELCTLVAGPRPGRPVYVARPYVNLDLILGSPVAGRLDPKADWATFTEWVTNALTNVDARLNSTAPIPNTDLTSGSDTPFVDLLLLLAVDPAIAWLLGLLWWDTTAAPGQEYLYWIVGTWGGVEYSWPVGPIVPAAPYEFALPADIGFAATVLPPQVQVDGTGPTGAPATAAGLSWHTAGTPTGASPLPADVAARWRVSRATLPFGTPSATLTAALNDPASYTPISNHDILDITAASAPAYLARDTGFPEGYQGWQLTGLDLFGRPSVPVKIGPISVWDERHPPSPQHVRATWLDPTALDTTGASSADPLMTAADIAWLQAQSPTSTALFLHWEWPPGASAAAPGVREFRLYAQPANAVPRLTGTITSVTPVAGSPQYSDVIIDTTLQPAADPFLGGTLRDGRTSFGIVQLSAPTPSTTQIRVLNSRDTQPSSPPPGADPGTAPLVQSISPPTYTTPMPGGTATVIANLQPASAWPERLTIIPKLPPLATTIGSVASVVVGTDLHVTLGLQDPIAHPDPAHGIYADSGYLERADGTTFQARLLVPADGSRTLSTTITALEVIADPALPVPFSAGDAVTFYPGLAVYLAHPSFRSSGESRAYALLTVTAANDSTAPDAIDDPVHATDPRWQESSKPRHGLESSTATPATVLDVSRTPPNPPPQPVAPLFTTWPDAAGTATFSLGWSSPDPNLRYVVVRAADQTLYAADRALRASPGYDTNLANLATTYPDPAHPGSPDYDAVYAADPGLLQQIASLAGNAAAFTARMTAPQGVADCTAAVPRREFASAGQNVTSEEGLWHDTTTGNLVYTDAVPGIGTTLYYYRVLAVDTVGNRSEPGPSTPPVATRVKAAPRPPVLDRSRTGDATITILWNHPNDGSADRYLVCHSTDLADLQDLDLLVPDVVSFPTVVLGTDPDSGLPDDSNVPLVGTQPALPPGLPQGATAWGWIATDRPPSDTYIVVVAVKDIPNGATLRSEPTPVIHVRPMENGAPPRPEITRLDRSGLNGAGHVEFTVDRPWHTVSVDIRQAGDHVWRSVSQGFVPPGPGVFEFPADAGVSYAVRVRARNGMGIASAPSQAMLV